MTVGDIAKPRVFITRLPFVVSTDSTASRSGVTSARLTCAISTGEPMNGTGLCGWVGASGQICVEMNTSPGRKSPFMRMSSSFAATVSATSAPSPSET